LFSGYSFFNPSLWKRKFVELIFGLKVLEKEAILKIKTKLNLKTPN